MVAVSGAYGWLAKIKDKRTVRLDSPARPVGEQNKRGSQARRSRAQRVAAN